MMLKRLAVAAAVVVCAGLIFAQTPAPSEMPTIQEPTEEQKAQQTGVMSGERPFYLVCDPSGELLYTFDAETNELDSISARKGVVFSSEDMTLNADQLDYKNKTATLVATGRKVVVRQGEIIATCQLFKYSANDQQSELSGSPVLYNKQRDGKVTTTSGDKIIIFKLNGKPQVKILGGSSAPRLNSAPSSSVPGARVMAPATEPGRAIMAQTQGAVAAPDAVMSGSSQPVGTTPAPVPAQESETTATAPSSGLLGISPDAVRVPNQ